jgi:hypothetical protein
MTYTFKLSRRAAQSRSLGMLLLLALTACTNDLQENSEPGQSAGLDDLSPVVVTPKRVVAEVGQKIQLTARYAVPSGQDGRRQLIDAPRAVDWVVSGGTITSNGEFSSTATGTFKVTGRARGRGRKTDTSTVVVVPTPPQVIDFTVSPDTAWLARGATRTFTAQAKLADSTMAEVGVTWSATGGTIDPGGVYTAGTAAGRFRAIATNGSSGLADTAAIVIDSTATPVDDQTPTLAAVHVTPDTASLVSGGTQRFVAQGRMSDGSTSTVSATYTATGGSIDSTGMFTAGSLAGTFRVIASAGDGLADTARVTVLLPQAGTTIYPGQSIQRAVDAFPAGTAFLLKAGIHRLQQVSPKSGNKFTGEVGAVLNGAALLTEFVREGGYWTAGGQVQQGESRLSASCQATAPGCAFPEQLFIDDVLLQHVTSLGAVGPGRWYFDYAADKIYFVDDPAGRKVELSSNAFAFYSTASNVTIENLRVEKYASPAQRGAIGFSGPGSGWVVRGNEVSWNHGAGIRLADGMRILSNNVHHQGQIGIAGSGRDVLVQDNEIAYNNMAGFGPGLQGEAGGSKFTFTDGLVVRGNFSHHNHGPGLWTDINNVNTLYENNRVEDNDWRGIFHEISYKAVIRNNVIRRNGFRNPAALVGAVDGAGILISNSPDVEVYGNIVEDNRSGITGLESDRSSSHPSTLGPHNLVNLYVHDNVVAQPDGGRAAGIANTDPNADPYSAAADNRWVHNTYTVGTATKWRWAPNADVSRSQWLAAQDSGSTFR